MFSRKGVVTCTIACKLNSKIRTYLRIEHQSEQLGDDFLGEVMGDKSLVEMTSREEGIWTTLLRIFPSRRAELGL